jgi:hypothetical protein
VRQPRRVFAAAILILVSAIDGRAQSANNSTPDDPFAAHRWHAEFALQAALEAWNYNISHEEVYGLQQGVTYGLRDGLVLMARQRLYYISQRLNDTRVLGLTGGLRARVYRNGRASAFLQFDMGMSDAAIAAPPRGTRFNYLASGGVGALVRLNSRLHLVSSFDVFHISNAGLKGPDRNPDIESIGPTLGLLVGF